MTLAKHTRYWLFPDWMIYVRAFAKSFSSFYIANAVDIECCLLGIIHAAMLVVCVYWSTGKMVIRPTVNFLFGLFVFLLSNFFSLLSFVYVVVVNLSICFQEIFDWFCFSFFYFCFIGHADQFERIFINNVSMWINVCGGTRV